MGAYTRRLNLARTIHELAQIARFSLVFDANLVAKNHSDDALGIASGTFA